MKHFRNIESGIDVAPFLEELKHFSGEWDVRRAHFIKVQRETVNIALRKPVPNPAVHANNRHESMKSEWYDQFPLLTEFLEQCARRQGGELCRAMIVDLKPNSKVYPHIDHGAYYAIRDRYHFVLLSVGGSLMRIEDEEVLFRPGEVWWYDNQGLHSSRNDSPHHRIHVIFDVLPKTLKTRLRRLLKIMTTQVRRSWYYIGT